LQFTSSGKGLYDQMLELTLLREKKLRKGLSVNEIRELLRMLKILFNNADELDQLDYHIEFDEHYYSVPYTLVGQALEIKITSGLIAVFKRGKRICSHRRSYDSRQKAVTVPEHMPKSHRERLEWTPSRILQWAAKYGQAVKELVEKIMTERSFPEQGYRACLGIIRLESKYSADKLNRACDRALRYRVHSYSGVRNILLNNLEELEESRTEKVPTIQHENIRGAEYYQGAVSLTPSLN